MNIDFKLTMISDNSNYTYMYVINQMKFTYLQNLEINDKTCFKNYKNIKCRN